MNSWRGFFAVDDGEEDEYDDEEGMGAVPLKSNCGALLSRQYYIVLPSVIVFWIIAQALIMTSSVCDSHIVVAEWTKQWNVAICGCFLLSSFHHLTISVMLANWYSKDLDLAYPRAVYSAAATVSFIAGLSALIKIFEDYKYVCVDALGVATFPSQWPEWMADVPLLCYITIALEDKEYLEVEDFLIIFGFFGMIAFGYVMNLTTDIPTAIFFLILSSACIASSYYLAQDASREIEVKTQVILEAQRSTSSPITSRKKWLLGRMVLKGRLSWLLLYLCPLFAAAYILRLLEVISPDQLMVANFLCSVVAKLFFVGILSLESVLNQIKNKRADQRRRILLDQTVERKFKITPTQHLNDKDGKVKPKAGSISTYSSYSNQGQHTASAVRSSDGDLYTQSPRNSERTGLIAGGRGSVAQSRSVPVSPGQSVTSFQVNENTHAHSSLRGSAINYHNNNHNDDGVALTGIISGGLSGTGGLSHLDDDLDRIDGEELLMRDLAASAGALLSSSSSSASPAASSAQALGQGNAAGQGLADTGENPKSSRTSATRVSISKTAQKRAQSWSTEQIRSAIDSMDMNSKGGT